MLEVVVLENWELQWSPDLGIVEIGEIPGI